MPYIYDVILEDEEVEDGAKEKCEEEDYSNLSALELLKKRTELIEAAKLEISGCAYALLAQPQQEVSIVSDVYRIVLNIATGGTVFV